MLGQNFLEAAHKMDIEVEKRWDLKMMMDCEGFHSFACPNQLMIKVTHGAAGAVIPVSEITGSDFSFWGVSEAVSVSWSLTVVAKLLVMLSVVACGVLGKKILQMQGKVIFLVVVNRKK